MMSRKPLDLGHEACITSISSPSVTVNHLPRIHDRHYYMLPCSNRINITVTALWVATPLLSTFSVAAVCVAVSTNQWLVTQESIKNGNYTGKGDQEYFPKSTISGLWTLCYTTPGRDNFFCSNIEYFPKEEYSPDLKDSTMAIPYTVTKSAAFFMLSTFLLFVGEFCCLCGHFFRQRRLLTFISGVMFIISGLLMLIGLVMYISIFKAEVGGKLRPTSQLQPAVFTYKYGYSFILYVSGFVSTEISGTCAVFLYIYWHQKDWRKKGYDLRSKFGSPTIVFDLNAINRPYPFCKKHPPYESSSNINGFSNSDEIIPKNFSPPIHRRLYLNDQQPLNDYCSPVCLKHSLSCSLVSELFSDRTLQNFIVDTTDPKRGFHKDGYHQQNLLSAYSFEFLAQNCYPNMSAGNFQGLDECSSIASHDHDFIPFDLDEIPPVPTASFTNLGDLLQKSEFVYGALRKTTQV